MQSEVFRSTFLAAKHGDQDAIEQLCTAYYPTVQRIAHAALRSELANSQLGSLFSTGDIVQDVFRRILGNLASFSGDSEGEFINYLCTAVRSRLLDMVRFHQALRRDHRRTATSVDAVASVATKEGPDEVLSADEQARIYFEVLARVASRQRVLLVRRLGGEASYQDLADQLDYPSADAARKAFCKARAHLLNELRKLGFSADLEPFA